LCSPLGNSSNSLAASTSASLTLSPLSERFLVSSPDIRYVCDKHLLASPYWPLLPKELYSPLRLDRLFWPPSSPPTALDTLAYNPSDWSDRDGGIGDAFRDVGNEDPRDRLLDLPGRKEDVSDPDASSSTSSSSSSSSTISVISEHVTRIRANHLRIAYR